MYIKIGSIIFSSILLYKIWKKFQLNIFFLNKKNIDDRLTESIYEIIMSPLLSRPKVFFQISLGNVCSDNTNYKMYE